MLVLSRKIGDKIFIGDDITITVVQLQGNRVRIGVEAPSGVAIRRDELSPKEKPCVPAQTEEAFAGSAACWGGVRLPS